MTTATRATSTRLAAEMGVSMVRRTPTVKPAVALRRDSSEERRPLFNAPMSNTVTRAAAMGVHETPSIYHREQPRIIGALIDAYS